MIREITTRIELEESVRILRESFGTVATEFDLTEENCPTNAAFITLEKLRDSQCKGERYFGLYEDDAQVGFVAIEKASNVLYYMEKLAVLPECRHRGCGKKLLDFVDDCVRRRKGEKISVGIINDNVILKNWYETHGYVETGTKRFDHLPFTVCFLEKKLGDLL